MRDVPHHMEEYLKNFSKMVNPQENKVIEEEKKEPVLKQQKKTKKAQISKETVENIPKDENCEEPAKKLKKRSPRIRERSRKTSF